MAARIIDGKQLAAGIRAETAQHVRAFAEQTGRPPGLAAVLVGDNPASAIYVRNKRKACEEVGIASSLHHLPAATSQAELLHLLDQLNNDPAVSGILVQLPLPRHIDEGAIIKAVSPLKDVDGFGPENLGLLAAGHPRFLPCTPHGVQQMLLRNDIPIEGSHVVILGRSNIVGKPLALILMLKGPGGNATVTVCHSRSRHLAELTRQADIIVAAIGQPRFLKADMVRPGAAVLDVGINRLPDGQLVGDVDFDAVRQVAGAISPVPGGVGPMTIAMLLVNTLHAARLQAGFAQLSS
jgi:methylenetetrahydrofolate dehydrogenase (NADP+)/methenyltetrahydrofolate cyclohydrolase